MRVPTGILPGKDASVAPARNTFSLPSSPRTVYSVADGTTRRTTITPSMLVRSCRPTVFHPKPHRMKSPNAMKTVAFRRSLSLFMGSSLKFPCRSNAIAAEPLRQRRSFTADPRCRLKRRVNWQFAINIEEATIYASETDHHMCKLLTEECDWHIL